VDPENRLQVTSAALLLHRPLELQQTGVLEKHHGKATHQGVRQPIAEVVRCPGILHRAKPRGQEVNNRL
jgi:hypothetical protein